VIGPAAKVSLALAALGAMSLPEGTSRRPFPVATGLDAPSLAVPARGVQALRPPLHGRVRIASGTFEMGSATRDLFDFLKLCESPTQSTVPVKQAIWARLCEEGEVKTDFRLEGQRHQVTLRAFDIDRIEVRVADYDRCVVAGACDPPGFAADDPRFRDPSFPVTQVKWQDAVAYCAWAGGRLPTEAEWEFAARGEVRRTFPWGDVYNPHLVNHGSWAFDETDASDGYALLAPVGSFPDGATPEGILDLAGNAAEWVSDFWGDPDENGYGYSSLAAVDPLGPPTGVYHVVRGGSYASAPPWLRTASRWRIKLPRSAEVGFRCAADAR
jgi:formylglycine-generating enzyme required for sulfatase activity